MSEKKKVPPRITPSREEKYMGMAWLIAGFSKDPSTQMGSVIVDIDNTPLGWGYNGPPSCIPDDSFSWERPEKYPFIKHAEPNAIDHSHGVLANSTLYVTGLPCKACMLDIVSNGIKRVVYMERDYDKNSMQAVKDDIAIVKDIAEKAGVELERFEGSVAWVYDWVLNLKAMGIFSP